MAQTTVVLKDLLETNFKLFDFEYEFDDKNMKREIEEHIINHYYFSEIGQETPDRFKWVFKTKFKSIIGYYNKLHNTSLLEYNPLINHKMEEALDQLSKTSRTQNTEVDRSGNRESTENESENLESSSDENTSELISDYPQQPIAGGDYRSGERTTNTGITGGSETIRNRESNSNTTDNETSNLTGEDLNNIEYQKTLEGLTGITYQELIKQERENILRIKSMIVEELKPCFILTY